MFYTNAGAAELRPNPSLEPRPNGKTRWPRGAFVYYAPHGQRVFPLVPSQLER